jgi:hypothetical protein
MADASKDKCRYRNRWGALKSERSSWDPHWRELSRNILPRNSRFMVDARNRGDRTQYNTIYDNTATLALRVLAAGMMAGMTSPARPWFRLSLHDKDLADFGPVKVWLGDVSRMMFAIMAAGNTYRSLHSTYEELGVFGTGLILIAPDFDNVIHHYPQTAGQYAITTDFKGRVNTAYREFQKTVAATVKQFGLKNVSDSTRRAYEAGNLDSWVTIVHCIEPNADRDPKMRDNKNMPFSSVYFEQGARPKQYLSESGFMEFPGLAPRWNVIGEDIYGHSPFMEALGDIRQLQHEQLRKANAIDYMTKPPIQLPLAAKGQESGLLPGGSTYIDTASPGGGIRTAFDVNLRLDYLLQDIEDVRGRIRAAGYSDMFLMLSQNNSPRMTATEVAERHEEKLLMLGPVLERLHDELLSPLIDMIFKRMVATNILPPPPPELQGVNIEVEFVSMLAQAQRAVQTNSTDRFVGNLGVIAGMKPDVLDKFDADSWADKYSDQLGVDPELIVSGKDVAVVRQARAEAQAKQAQMDQAEQAATAAAKLGGVPTGNGSNAGSDILNMFSGYQSPSGVEL